MRRIDSHLLPQVFSSMNGGSIRPRSSAVTPASRVTARATSRLFDALGLPDYEAIETFHRWTVG